MTTPTVCPLCNSDDCGACDPGNGVCDSMQAETFIPVTVEDKLWDDAYHIAWIGACNPRAVKFTIDEYLAAGVEASHPAIAAMQGHLDFLNGESLGPSFDLLGQVRERHNQSH